MAAAFFNRFTKSTTANNEECQVQGDRNLTAEQLEHLAEKMILSSNEEVSKGFLLVFRQFTTPTHLFSIWQQLFAKNKTRTIAFLMDWLHYFGRTDFNTRMIKQVVHIIQNESSTLQSDQIIRLKLLILKNTSTPSTSPNPKSVTRSSTWTQTPKPNILKSLSLSKSFESDNNPLHKLQMKISPEERRRNRSISINSYINPSLTERLLPKATDGNLKSGISINKKERDHSYLYLIDPAVMAETMTSIEQSLFEKIKPIDLLDKDTWKDANSAIKDLIDHFNNISCWVSLQILFASQFEEQVRLLEYFICTAKHCHDMANYNALMEILSGLNNFSVLRLKRLWDSIPEKSKKLFKQLESVMSPSSNYKVYREEVLTKFSEQPVLPYFGIFLREITFITEGNKMFSESKKKINTEVLVMLWRQIHHLEQFQNKPFPCLRMNGWIKGYLRSVPPMTDDQLFELSKQWE